MPELKYVNNPAKFLIDSGLLFEINRLVLHPYGLALGVGEGEGSNGFFELWDCRDDEEGVLFSQEAFERGKAKLEKFAKEHQTNIERRIRTVGFVIQEDANV